MITPTSQLTIQQDIRSLAPQNMRNLTQGNSARQLLSLTSHQTRSLDSALKQIFPEQREENHLLQARRIMGDLVEDLSDSELEVCLSEFQYLLECWMDEFERSKFNNLTLKQLLREV